MTLYEETFEAWRREYHSKEIQTLRTDYFKDLAAHIRSLKEAQRNLDPKSLKASLIEEELRRLQTLAGQLITKRLDKIQEASRGKEQPQVDPNEKWVLEQYNGINRHVQTFKEDIAHGKTPQPEPGQKKDTLLIRFLKDVPSIIGVDLKTHGPFLKEDVASLPFENAEGLIRQGSAIEIKARLQENG